MVAEGGPAKKLLVVNTSAGSISQGDLERLQEAFPDCVVLSVGPDDDLQEILDTVAITDDALVIAVGGDGTVAAVARSLAGSRHAFGIVPRGTFNNFARALEIPLDFDEAVEV